MFGHEMSRKDQVKERWFRGKQEQLEQVGHHHIGNSGRKDADRQDTGRRQDGSIGTEVFGDKGTRQGLSSSSLSHPLMKESREFLRRETRSA